MSESVHESQVHDDPVIARPDAENAISESTGNEHVDEVVASLAGLDDQPVSEHVAVFEQAHETLRRTLSGAGQDGPVAGRG